MYRRALREQELEVDRLTHELVSTQGFLERTQTTLQESYNVPHFGTSSQCRGL
jgi:hypothetical protein